MRGKEKLIPHAARAGRWLGWLTVWSHLSTPFLDVCSAPAVNSVSVNSVLPAAEAAVRENGELQNTNPK